MKKLLLYFSLLFVSSLLSQTVSVRGTLSNEQELTPLKSAIVSLDGKVLHADSSGYFEFSAVKGRLYHVRIRQQGYRTWVQKITFLSDTTMAVFIEPDVIALNEITIEAQKDNAFGISRLNNIEGTTIYAGKKSEAVYLQDLNANLAANNSRQVFSKVAGINIFENDGSGATIGIGGRGLNPNRISNFNTRQNGYDISADALGYPESYYTPPTEAIERIEILRGAAGLQFGTQFGGMINYKFREPSSKKISGNFRETTGSYGFVNSFNQVSGSVGRFAYNTFYQYKHYDGWRERSELNSHTAFASVRYQFTDKLTVKAEYTWLNYLSQQPGGLTDAQFREDYTQVTRYRNWFRVKWNLLSLSADYRLNPRTRISFVSFGLLAGREALGVLYRPDRPDDPSANRNLLSDKYRNFGAELRLLRRYALFRNNSHLLIGARYYNGNTTRRQGDADSTSKPHFDFLHPDRLENSSYTFPSRNAAVFMENVFQLTKRWSVTPGLRYEYISTASDGYYRYTTTNLADSLIDDRTVQDRRSNSRSFFLAGIGTQLKLNDHIEFYANISQNYRSINFNDMRVLNPSSQVNPNLKDENGYTADLGFRGVIKNVLYFDVSGFLLQYNDRIGTALTVDTASYLIVRYRTNIGNSRNMGVEAFAELDWIKLVRKDSKHRLSTFVNASYINAVYQTKDIAYNNKKVEFVPDIIFRTGLTYGYKKFALTYQYSYVSEQFSDATNAKFSAAGIYGLIPSYSVMDLSLSYGFKQLTIAAGLNNLANAKYYTRRADGYPGPGIIPADPINFYFTIGVKF